MKYIFGNWKENNTLAEVQAYIKDFKKQNLPSDVHYGLAVPYLYLQKMNKKLSKKCEIGVQNVSFSEKGEYTGEISAKMLVDFDCSFCLVGHSERRQKFKETNEEINKKILMCFENGIMPILCVGETKEEKDDGKTKKVLKTQLTKCLQGIPLSKQFMVAYEPVWAIGTGVTPTSKEIEENILYVKKVLEENVKKIGVCVLYGGSVNPQNVRELLNSSSVDGALVGGASLNAKKFVDIGKNLANVRR